MKLEMITEGLKELLLENHYNPATIRFYEREWKKIHTFLTDEYGDTEYEMERGLRYLEKQYSLITRYNDGTLSQQRVQLLRVVHMLEDYSLHKVLTRRYHASKNPLTVGESYTQTVWIHLNYLPVPSATIKGLPPCSWIILPSGRFYPWDRSQWISAIHT